MKNIILKKSDAVDFFGSVAVISELIGVSQPAVSQWGVDIPELSAWRLLHISKNTKFRRNKLKAIINI